MEWHIDHVRHYISSTPASTFTDRKEQIESLYRAYLCVTNEEERKLLAPVIKPYGANLGVEYMVYNLVEQKVEQLIGDYLDRPIKRKAYVMNKTAQSRKLKAKIDMMAEEFFRKLNKEFEQEYDIALSTEQPEIEIPEDVEEFFAKDYKDIAEEVSDDLMEKFLDVDKQKREIVDLLRDWFISFEAHVEIFKQNNRVKWRKVSPMDARNDRDPHKVVQDDHEYYINWVYMSENEIYNEFDLTKKQREQIKVDFALLVDHQARAHSPISSGQSWVRDTNWYVDENKEFRLAVIKMVWKSRKDLSVKISKNKKTGDEIYKRVNRDERIRKDEKLEIYDIETERHVVMAGPNVCVSHGLAPFRNYKNENKRGIHLNYVSVYGENTIGVDSMRSVAAKLKKLQDWASEQLYELRIATRRNQGKVMIYDTAQIPRQYLRGDSKAAYKNALNRVMHHAKKDAMIFINSKDKNNRYNFNQFTSVDLSTTGLIQDIINGLALIEDLADKVIGLTPGRQGNAGQYSTATNVETQRQASFSRTEVYYRPFDDFLQTAMERVTMLQEKVHQEGEHIQYVLGDMKTKFLRIPKEFTNSDIGWYLSDGGKDAKKKQIVDQAAQLALGNAQTEEMILSLIDVLSADTASESRAILERAVAASAKLREQNAQSQMQQAQDQLAQKADAEKRKEDIQMRGQDKDIAVAKIYANEQRGKRKDEKETKLLDSLAKFEKDNLPKPASPEKSTETKKQN
ncbi:MAG: hypothetical protein EX254_04695 [Flavobacteriaceae bacterium]|nr:MAG: hypothetical protein EX254_04695 [Flavobacteriaceae bacterium]